MYSGYSSNMATSTETIVLTHATRRIDYSGQGHGEDLKIEILQNTDNTHTLKFTVQHNHTQYSTPRPQISYHALPFIPTVVLQGIKSMNTTNMSEITSCIQAMLAAFDADQKAIVLQENAKTDGTIRKLRTDLENAYTKEQLLCEHMEEEIQLRDNDIRDTVAFLTKKHREDLEKKDRQLQETILLMHNQNLESILDEAFLQLEI